VAGEGRGIDGNLGCEARTEETVVGWGGGKLEPAGDGAEGEVALGFREFDEGWAVPCESGGDEHRARAVVREVEGGGVGTDDPGDAVDDVLVEPPLRAVATEGGTDFVKEGEDAAFFGEQVFLFPLEAADFPHAEPPEEPGDGGCEREA
jgi:hypothetical protein